MKPSLFCPSLLIPNLNIHEKTPQISRLPFTICCGLRRETTRKPLWRGTAMSKEAIQAVQALKLAKSSKPNSNSSSSCNDDDERMTHVFRTRIVRLVKGDLVAVLAELQRQNQWEIATKVFDFMRKDLFRPDLSLYGDMIFMLGKNELLEMAEQLFSDLEKEGLQPDTRVYTEMIGVYLKFGMVDKAMNIYILMKDSGCNPDILTLTILIRNLDKAGEEDHACSVRKDCEKYMEYPARFLEEIDRTYPKRRSLRLL